MKSGARYHRFVCRSEEDACCIGYCPDLYEGRVCHGEQEKAVYSELCKIVRDEIGHRLAEGQALPEPAVQATRDLHRSLRGSQPPLCIR
ncbi:pilus assembly protein HicB [Luteolibacter sp. Populi]|uniref:pilus assembly protein HicB n=1 Tax=Luteolibacter sp. Populi TaxID=3230487 RepID=UPI00346551EF